MTLYYYEKEFVCFSDKSQRSDAVKELVSFYNNVYGKEFYDNKDVPHVIIIDAVEKRKMYDYGVRNDYDGKKWARVKSVQSVHNPDNLVISVVNEATNTVENKTLRLVDKYRVGMKLKSIGGIYKNKEFKINRIDGDRIHIKHIKNEFIICNLHVLDVEKDYMIIEEKQSVDYSFKFEIGDEVITSDGDTARVVNRNSLRNYRTGILENTYLVESHCRLFLENRWFVEEELSRSSGFDLKQYVRDACRTECDYGEIIFQNFDKNSVPSNKSNAKSRAVEYIDLLHGIVGLGTEIGELQDSVKRFIFYGKELDKVNVAEEIGDIMWYVAIVCKSLRLDLEEVLRKNIDKLRKRYPEKFSEDKALNRDLNAERKILEV